MSQFQTNSKEVVNASKLITHVAIMGRLVPETNDDFMKLARLAHDFRKAVLYATRLIARGVDENSALRELRLMLNKAYGDSAYKVAKAFVEGCRYSNGNLKHIKVRKLFIVSEGEATRFGNRNVRLLHLDEYL